MRCFAIWIASSWVSYLNDLLFVFDDEIFLVRHSFSSATIGNRFFFVNPLSPEPPPNHPARQKEPRQDKCP